ncbi:MAG TPA: VOC family protein [Pirellulales bacterium]|nr:VOC family protein [Pirellulales bacterium]
MSDPASRVECTIPVLPVRDLARSIAFYTETLGFKLDWGGAAGSCICSVSRDGHAIMLSERTSIAEPAWVWIGLEDEALFEGWRSRGVKVRQEAKNFSWAYEMKFEDPDGNVLWLGTEARTDEPFED